MLAPYCILLKPLYFSYCNGRKIEVKCFIDKKKLIDSYDTSNEEDNNNNDDDDQTLMSFLDNECRQIVKYCHKYQSQIIVKLWKIVESELLERLETKKENMKRHKPSRLIKQYKAAIPIMMREKRAMFENLEIVELEFDDFDKSM